MLNILILSSMICALGVLFMKSFHLCRRAPVCSFTSTLDLSLPPLCPGRQACLDYIHDFLLMGSTLGLAMRSTDRQSKVSQVRVLVLPALSLQGCCRLAVSLDWRFQLLPVALSGRPSVSLSFSNCSRACYHSYYFQSAAFALMVSPHSVLTFIMVPLLQKFSSYPIGVFQLGYAHPKVIFSFSFLISFYWLLSTQRFLNFGSTGILNGIILCWGGCPVCCLVVSLASTHKMMVASPPSSSVVTTKNCQIFPGGESPSVENHCSTPCQYHTDLIIKAWYPVAQVLPLWSPSLELYWPFLDPHSSRYILESA